MAHQRQRRNLASLDPKPTMDPTSQKYTISHPSNTAAAAIPTKPHYHHQYRHHPPHPDSTIPPSSTIQSISNHFSKLYTNHKIMKSSKIAHPHPSIDTTFQAKPKPISSDLDTSCTTLTKSKSQHGRRYSYAAADPQKESTKNKGAKEKVLVKVPFEIHEIEKPKPYEIIKRECKTKEEDYGYEEKKRQPQDVKKALALMSRSYNEGSEEVKRPSFSVAINGGGRRKSFCSSQTELADFFSCTGVRVVAVDMPPFMQIHAVDCARKAHDSLEKFTAKSLALTLKKEFDGVYGPAWHCIVGTSFGSFVTHSVGGFMYFSMDQKLYILLFKTTVQKAE